jgi:hypothetical protein
MTVDLAATPPSLFEDAAAARAAFFARGFHIEPDLVPAETCDRVIATGNAQPNARDGTFKPIAMPHRVDPGFLEMMRFPPIVALIETLIGARASGLGADYSYMRPGTPGWLEHQDNLYIQAPPDKFVSAWTALCDVGPENGGLFLYPGSHRFGELPIERLTPTSHAGQNVSAEALRAVMPVAIEPVHPRITKGTCVFMHSLLVHGSNPNTTRDRFRNSFLATYIETGQPFRPGTQQRRAEVELHVAV